MSLSLARFAVRKSFDVLAGMLERLRLRLVVASRSFKVRGLAGKQQCPLWDVVCGCRLLSSGALWTSLRVVWASYKLTRRQLANFPDLTRSRCGNGTESLPIVS